MAETNLNHNLKFRQKIEVFGVKIDCEEAVSIHPTLQLVVHFTPLHLSAVRTDMEIYRLRYTRSSPLSNGPVQPNQLGGGSGGVFWIGSMRRMNYRVIGCALLYVTSMVGTGGVVLLDVLYGTELYLFQIDNGCVEAIFERVFHEP
uniref:Uncharacterized protein n=1 Tax=Timema tahoe TaxID=61484 RepID=A0A7R9NXI5_9NEOP|nr:unnamed protein product [Timema tahoe]